MPRDTDASNQVLEVRDLVTRFYTPEGVVHAVNGVSLSLNEGGTLGIVGESGCGKSVTMLSVMRLISEPPGKIERGEAVFRGQDLLKIPQADMRAIRGSQIAMVFQDPMTSLNPVMTIGRQVAEPLVEHQGLSYKQAEGRVVELLRMVGISDAKSRLGDYPHQFSGGMRQRVMISMALTCNPSILIADEPTTALDVTIQAQIIELVKRLRDELGMAVIWITHDLGIIAGLAEHVVVMYAGYLVEKAHVRDLYASPQHPYTLGLLGSLPRIDGRHSRRLTNIEGRPPDLLEEPICCPFAPRCHYVQDVCWTTNPGLRDVGDEHSIACWVNVGEVAHPQKALAT
jgi:oligopeptide transport system ATP-binding protein